MDFELSEEHSYFAAQSATSPITKSPPVHWSATRAMSSPTTSSRRWPLSASSAFPSPKNTAARVATPSLTPSLSKRSRGQTAPLADAGRSYLAGRVAFLSLRHARTEREISFPSPRAR